MPPTHQIGDRLIVEDERIDSDEDFMDEMLSHDKRMLKRKKRSQIKILGGPLVAKKSYQLSINIYKAENLPKIKGIPNSFVSARSMGLVEKTHVVEGSNAPV